MTAMHQVRRRYVPALCGLGVLVSAAVVSAQPAASDKSQGTSAQPAAPMGKGAEGNVRTGGAAAHAARGAHRHRSIEGAASNGVGGSGAGGGGAGGNGAMGEAAPEAKPVNLKERLTKGKEMMTSHAAKLRERAKAEKDPERKARLEERAKRITARASKLDEDTVKAFLLRGEERAQTRKARRENQVKEARARWGARLATMQAQGEMQKHARRVARLNRIRELAELESDEKTIERVDALLLKEAARHEKRMNGSDGASGKAMAPADQPAANQPATEPTTDKAAAGATGAAEPTTDKAAAGATGTEEQK